MAARFRVFEKPFPYCPEKVILIVKACCAFHNWLKETKLQYRQFEYTVDSENFDTGAIVRANWRDGSEPNDFESLKNSLANHSTRRSQDLRERYADYLVAEGSVPW